MIQACLDFKPPITVPERGQLRMLLMAMKAGERLTVAYSLSQYGVYALSQRMGELRKAGWPIKSRMIETETGKHVAEYWLAE